MLGFFASLVGGFLLLSLLGRLVSAQNHFEDFLRFHLYISPSALYYPTASQLLALAKASARPDQVIVIVGGDSVMQGFGQSDDDLWTRRLQAALGDRFRVLNFAMYAERPVEHGGVAAQALIKQGYRVIYVADLLLLPLFGPPDGLAHPYVFWDAYYKGLLLDDDERMPRIELNSQAAGGRATFDELRLRTLLDSWFYFTDLWQAFGHTTLFTAWSHLVPPEAGFTAPRRRLHAQQDSFALPFNFLPMGAHLQAWIGLACRENLPGDWVDQYVPEHWDQFNAEARAGLPAALRERTILWIPYVSAFYLEPLTERERRCYRRVHQLSAAQLSSLGYRPLLVGSEWGYADYLDQYHLAPSGGEKLTWEVASKVYELAQQLGYLDSDP